MLQKRRDLGSMPDGLGVTASAINKGTAVVRKFVTGKYTYAKPSTLAEAQDVYGFIELRIDDNEHPAKYYDTIASGKKAVVYTLVKNNEWATTEFIAGTYAKGDKLAVDFTEANAGKLRKVDTVTNPTEVALFEVVAVQSAGAGYTDGLLTVKVL